MYDSIHQGYQGIKHLQEEIARSGRSSYQDTYQICASGSSDFLRLAFIVIKNHTLKNSYLLTTSIAREEDAKNFCRIKEIVWFLNILPYFQKPKGDQIIFIFPWTSFRVVLFHNYIRVTGTNIIVLDKTRSVGTIHMLPLSPYAVYKVEIKYAERI